MGGAGVSRGRRGARLWVALVLAALLGGVGVSSAPASADHVPEVGDRLYLCCPGSLDIPRWFPGNSAFHVSHGWPDGDPTTRFDLYIDGVKQAGIEHRHPGVFKFHVYNFPTGLVGRHEVRAEWWEQGVVGFHQGSVLFAACKSWPATIVGTNQGEVLSGTSGRDVVVALGGDDTITTFGGGDVICAGSGDDEVNAGRGRDLIWGQGGSDLIRGGSGSDTIFGNGGADTIFGNGGADAISGGKGKDVIEGGKKSDTLSGNSGRDTLRGNSGADELRGGTGTDICRGGGGTDTAFSCETATGI